MASSTTPLFVVLVMIGTTDVIFAVDSIPAIFAITDDPFIVLTANIFAILGLRALYFLLADLADRFHLLAYGLALVLVFIGGKCCCWTSTRFRGRCARGHRSHHRFVHAGVAVDFAKCAQRGDGLRCVSGAGCVNSSRACWPAGSAVAGLGQTVARPSQLFAFTRRPLARGLAIGLLCGLIPGPLRVAATVMLCSMLRANVVMGWRRPSIPIR